MIKSKVEKKKGISLIVLIITIIVMAILATVVIINMRSDDQTSKAKQLKIKSQVDNMIEEYNNFLSHMENEYVAKGEIFNSSKLNADSSSAKYNRENIEDVENIYDIITNIPDDFEGYFKIENGKLTFISSYSGGTLTDEEKGYITQVIGENNVIQ